MEKRTVVLIWNSCKCEKDTQAAQEIEIETLSLFVTLQYKTVSQHAEAGNWRPL